MLLINANLATMADPEGYGLIHDAALVVKDGVIAWLGSRGDLPGAFSGEGSADLEGRLVTPALIDCHTHIVHGGHRAVEFEQRLTGVSYEQIAKQGGGIASTVNQTRKADVADLIKQSLPRIDALIAEGVSTIEIKSGYGLDHNTELAMLRAARQIQELRNVRVKTSFLGAHAIPAEYRGQPDAYLEEVCLPTLEAAHAEGLVDAVDGFCETIAFTPEQIDIVFRKARSLGLPVKLHAEQLSNTGGVKLATRHKALSVDHIEYADQTDVEAMAASQSVAVLLPGAFYTLRETQLPPIEHLRSKKVEMALATDSNPGSSPLTSLLLTMNMGCTLFGLTPTEAFAGVTRNAAKALGLTDTGHLSVGLRADLAIWNVEHPAELAYRMGFNPLHSRVFAGEFQ